MQYLVYLNELVAVNNHHVLSQSEHLERLLSSEGSFKTVALIISNIGDKLNLVKVQLFSYRNHCGSGITKPYDKRTWRFLSALIHSWTAIIPISSLHFKLKSCTLLSALLKVKFSGEYQLFYQMNYFISGPQKPGRTAAPLPLRFLLTSTFHVLKKRVLKWKIVQNYKTSWNSSKSKHSYWPRHQRWYLVSKEPPAILLPRSYYFMS